LKRNIALVGFRSTGKTTVGRALAKLTGMELRETDVIIERRAGKTIATIFREDGEGSFRDLESRITAEVCAEKDVIIAAGGGAIMRRENLENITRNCLVVLLEADTDTILARMQGDPETEKMRPSLTSLPPREEIEHLIEKRNPVYHSAADVTIDTAGRSVEEIAAAIAGEYRRLPKEKD
jgi:shikimate kinase